MLSRVIAKNIGDVFLRHSVYRDNFVKNVTLFWRNYIFLITLIVSFV